jgi:hypothetical protein
MGGGGSEEEGKERVECGRGDIDTVGQYSGGAGEGFTFCHHAPIF